MEYVGAYLHTHRTARYALMAISPLILITLVIGSMWALCFAYLAVVQVQRMMPVPRRVTPDFMLAVSPQFGKMN